MLKNDYHGEENIQKIFFMDICEKKRTGSNIFKRCSTRRGGVKQALKTPYYFMTNKQRKGLNGEVKTSYTLMPIEKFKEFEEEKQKEIMELWREQHSIRNIIDSLGITDRAYYILLDNLNIERDYTKHKSKRVSKEKLEEYKHDIVDYKTLMKLPTDQRAEVMSTYNNNFSSKELAEIWEIKLQKVYNLKYHMKKVLARIQREKENDKQKKFIAEQPEKLTSLSEKLLSLKGFTNKQDSQKSVNNLSSQVDNKEDDFYFTINQDGESDSINKKLKMLLELLEDGEKYNVSLTVKRV